LKCRVRPVGCRTVNCGIANLKKFAKITEYLFLQIDDKSLFKTEIIKNRKTKEYQKNYISLSDLLFTTSESLIDFCETDEINVAGLTKVALYILDRFSAQITYRVEYSISPHKNLCLFSNFHSTEVPLVII
jgi:hypothetical protein